MYEEDIIVSVVLISYNAEKYIKNTLESVKIQTYKTLNLVISDDCSTDLTKEICENWIKNNSERFLSVIFTQMSHNKGVVFNLNNGIKKATGNWIKILAGDDLLPPESIEKYINYIKKQGIKTICCSKSVSFIEKNGTIQIVGYKPDPYTKKVFGMSATDQYKKMLMEYVILLPITAIIAKELYDTIGYYNETFPEIEDQPFFLKIAQNGIKINYCDDIVGYMHRTNIDSISQTTTGIMNEAAFRVDGKLHHQDKLFVLPNIKKYHIVFYYHYYLDLLRRYVIITTLKNKDTSINRFINKLFLALDPVFMKKKIYNILHSDR